MASKFAQVFAGGHLGLDEAVPSDFTNEARALLLPSAASDAALESAMGRSAAAKDLFYQTANKNYRAFNGVSWSDILEPELDGLGATQLYRISTFNLGLQARPYTSKRLWVRDEYVDLSAGKTMATSSNAINASGTDSGAAPADSTFHYVYLSNSSSSYAPGSVRCSTTSPASNGYLGTTGNAVNWRLVGVVYLGLAGSIGTYSFCGFGVDVLTVSGALTTKSSGGAAWVTELSFPNLCMLNGTNILYFYQIASNYNSTAGLQHRLYDFTGTANLAYSESYLSNESFYTVLFKKYLSTAHQRRETQGQYYYPGSGTYTGYTGRQLIAIRSTKGLDLDGPGAAAAPEYVLKWTHRADVINGAAFAWASDGNQFTQRYYYQLPGALNDEINWGRVTLQAGTYNFKAWGVTSGSAGTVEWRLTPVEGDDITIVASQVWTGGLDYDHVETETVEIPYSGHFDLKSKVIGTGGSQYYFYTNFAYFEKA